MAFDVLLSQLLLLLQREERVSYRAIKLRFQIDDDHLEAVNGKPMTVTCWFSPCRTVADEATLQPGDAARRY